MNKDTLLRLDKTLGVIEKIIPESTDIEKKTGDVRDGHPVSSTITSEDVDNDYKYQRENLYNLIERGQDAIDGILELAKESEHPRTYEVALNGIKQVAEVTEKLGELQTYGPGSYRQPVLPASDSDRSNDSGHELAPGGKQG